VSERPTSRYQAERQLAERAARDAAFRVELVRDPKGTVAREFDIPNIPDDLTITVVEESSSQLFIVLPPPTEQLSPAEGINLSTKWIFF